MSAVFGSASDHCCFQILTTLITESKWRENMDLIDPTFTSIAHMDKTEESLTKFEFCNEPMVWEQSPVGEGTAQNLCHDNNQTLDISILTALSPFLDNNFLQCRHLENHEILCVFVSRQLQPHMCKTKFPYAMSIIHVASFCP